jgi:hypothetical protein
LDWVPGNPNDRSITGFRTRHGGARGPMSKTKYAKLKKEGRAPRESWLGPNDVIITKADEEEWDRARAEPVGTEARLVAKAKEIAAAKIKMATRASMASPRHVSKQKRRRQ